MGTLDLRQTHSIDIGSLVAANGIDLQPAGTGRLRGLCPFHNERNPSFFVFPDSNRFYCFGCHEHGDAIDFVRRMHGFDFRQALSFLGIDRLHPTVGKLRMQASQQAAKRAHEWKERELAWTLGTAIRLCHEALRKLNRENFGLPDMALILTELDTLQYQHDLLIYGDQVERAAVLHDLAGLRPIKRTSLFHRKFDFRAWLRATLQKSEPPVVHMESQYERASISFVGREKDAA